MTGVTGFVVRFLTAGLVVACLPWLTARLGPRIAAVALMVPVVTALGLWAVGATQGADAMADVARAGVAGLLVVAAFLVVVYAIATGGGSPSWALAGGLLGWAVAAMFLIHPTGFAASTAILAAIIREYLLAKARGAQNDDQEVRR